MCTGHACTGTGKRVLAGRCHVGGVFGIPLFSVHCVPRTRASTDRCLRCFTEDEGGPLEVGLQEQASNRHKLRGLRALAVSVVGKVGV